MTGFWISQICVRGSKVADATLTFQRGLNVLSGGSDTGKSYLLGCIRYMMGGEEPPDSIPLDKNYEHLFLEINTYEGETFTLERSLKRGGDFRVYDCALTDIADNAPIEMTGIHRSGRRDTLPDKLLDICDLHDIQIRLNKDGAKRRLRFGDIANFSLIDETRIIGKNSPLWPSGQNGKYTEENNAFNFLITGEDDSAVITAPEPKLVQAGWTARAALLDSLIADAELDAGESNPELAEQLEKLKKTIEGVSTEVVAKNAAISELLDERKGHWETVRQSRSRIAVIAQLEKRFALLREHYESDLERLSFLRESDHYLSQLGDGHCPFCGQLLKDHSQEKIAEESSQALKIQEAAAAEQEKLRRLIVDLENTMKALAFESNQLMSTIDRADDRLKVVSRSVQENLEPELVTVKEEFEMLLRKRAELEMKAERQTRLEQLVLQRAEMGKKPTQAQIRKDVEVSPTAEVSSRRREFCDAMEERLRTWAFPTVGAVELHRDKGNRPFDVVVNGQKARSHGKGYRALIHSAFTITLMYESQERHTKLVILDSPLTSFKDKDRVPVSEDVQLAFYRDLVKTTDDCQIILLENKDPLKEFQEQINYVHFSGNPSVGRYGFYPVDDVQDET